MNPVEQIIDATDMADVVDALGIRRRGMRFPMPDRETGDFNGVCRDKMYYDNARQCGGGLIDFVVLVTGKSRREALAWLSELARIPLGEQTPTEKRAWARRRSAAESEAVRFEQWRQAELVELPADWKFWLAEAEHLSNLIVEHGFDDPRANGWADGAEAAESEYVSAVALGARLHVLRPEDMPGLIATFRAITDFRAATASRTVTA